MNGAGSFSGQRHRHRGSKRKVPHPDSRAGKNARSLTGFGMTIVWVQYRKKRPFSVQRTQRSQSDCGMKRRVPRPYSPADESAGSFTGFGMTRKFLGWCNNLRDFVRAECRDRRTSPSDSSSVLICVHLRRTVPCLSLRASVSSVVEVFALCGKSCFAFVFLRVLCGKRFLRALCVLCG